MPIINNFTNTKSINSSKWKNKRTNKHKANAKKLLIQAIQKTRKEHSAKKSLLKNQAGILPSTADLLSYLPIVPGIDTSLILSEVENISALFFALRDASSSRQVAAILFLFLKTHCTGSVLVQMVEYIKIECDFDLLTPQSSDSIPEWIRLMRSCKDNWSAVVQNNAFKKISTLLSMSAALGLCDLAKFKFDVNGIRIFSISSYKHHVTASDMIGAVIETVSYFIEGGYKCFKIGSFSPFIFSGDAAQQFEADYFEMLDLAPFMKAGNLLRKKQITENDFDFKLTHLIDSADSLYKAAEGTWEKKILFDRLFQLRKIRSDFITVRVDGKLREAPFAIYVEGPSGVGKSSVSAILMRTVLLANGFDASDERLITINEADKYMSTYRSFMNGIFIDDLGNTQAQFVEKSPVAKVIEIINNVPAYANMAEAELKGKVSIEPRCVIGTSNVNINTIARQYSNEPYSIARRFPIQTYVTVKKEFAMDDGRLDSSKVHDKYPNGIPAIPDLWDIKVFSPHFDPSNGNICYHATMNIMELVVYSKNMSMRHFRNQLDVVDFASNLDEKMEFCSKCHLPGCMCKCVLDNQMFEQQTEYIRSLISEISIYDSKWLQWTNYLPTYLFDNRYVDMLLTYLRRHQINAETLVSQNIWKGSIFIGLISIFWSFLLALFIIFSSTFMYGRKLMMKKSQLIRQLRDANGAMPLIFKRIRDNHVATIAVTGSVLGVIYMLVKAYKSTRVLTQQGTLTPTSRADIQQRDAEGDPWAEVHVSELPSTEIAERCTHDQLKHNVFKNLFYMELTDSKSTKYCNAFFPKSNITIIPAHMWIEDEVIAKFYRRGDNTNGAYFKSRLSKKFAVKIPNMDLYMAWVSNSCSMKDLSEYFALGDYHSVPATMIYKKKSGERADYKAKLAPGMVYTHVASFKGFNYRLAEKTFDGMCMGTWISDSVKKQILGFQLGGAAHRGGAGQFTLSMLRDAEAQLRALEGVLLAKSTGTIMTEQYGVKFFKHEDVHYKSPTRFLPKGNNVKIYGTVEGRSVMRSTVIDTNISHIVAAVTGVTQKWGPPKFGPERWKPWQASLQYSSNPSIGMKGVLLQKAVIDFKLPLIKLITDNEPLKNEIHPLSRMETVCGIDGKRFIDKMKPLTSVGYPLAGPKAIYLTALNPEDFDNFSCPMELNERFWNEFERMEEEYLAGRRCYPVFKASLKDEPTPMEKDKVRVFQAAPLALQLLVRKYYLPLARILSLYPLVSECAVGVNPYGPEWNELSEHVKKYGADRILAGDYSKYDLRMSSQLMAAAFRVLIDMATSTGNYSERDISIMEGIATDICQPLMAYNGDYIQHVGSNPSGQNLTVYINSIVNALLFRCAYFHIYADRKDLPPFKEVCALITYGDDAKSSVRAGFDEFNHIAVADFLEANDMKFTMPDKTSTPTKFMTDETADLLKRKNIVNPETGLIFGALDESSIFKSLHSVLKSTSVSNEEQCMNNIDGALREWFAHGRDIYELRRAQMQRVAQLADITHGCQELQTTYDECVDRFCEKYDVSKLE
jgi:uncharacterized protein YeaO (DUF488 family)